MAADIGVGATNAGCRVFSAFPEWFVQTDLQGRNAMVRNKRTWTGNAGEGTGDEADAAVVVDGGAERARALAVSRGYRASLGTFAALVGQLEGAVPRARPPEEAGDGAPREPRELLEAVGALHELILPLVQEEGADGAACANAISGLCEACWAHGRAGGGGVVPQSLSYLLLRCVEGPARSSDVRRLGGLRDALGRIDFGDASAGTVRRLLVRAAISPGVVRRAAGARFVAAALVAHASLVGELHAAIKCQLRACRRAGADAYAAVYFRAWQASAGQLRALVERACVQDLMHLAIHVASEALALTLARVLSHFHARKPQRGVDEMLARLYAPILWRSLAVANPLVRRNAARLFFDAFPVQDPDAPARELDEGLQRQFALFAALLRDPHDGVRRTAVGGACRALALYWEAVPAVTAGAVLAALEQLAHDRSSPAVRAAVFGGLRALLENHAAHAPLRALLPRLAPLVHDTSEAVRAAVLDLLDAAQHLRAFRFYRIVPLRDLLCRLGAERDPLARRLAALLQGTYFPCDQPAPALLLRAQKLIVANRAAAHSFFRLLPRLDVPIDAVVTLIRKLYSFLLQAAAHKETDGGQSDSNGNNNVTDGDAGDAASGSTKKPKRKRGKKNQKQGENEEEEEEDVESIEKAVNEAAGTGTTDDDDKGDEDEDDDIVLPPGTTPTGKPQKKRTRTADTETEKKTTGAFVFPEELYIEAFEAIALLWKGLGPRLVGGNAKWRDKLTRHVTWSGVCAIAAAIGGDRARGVSLTVTSCMSADAVVSAERELVERFQHMVDEPKQEEFTPLLSCLFARGLGAQTLAQIAQWIGETFGGTTDGSTGAQTTAHGAVALHLLNSVLADSEMRKQTFRDAEAVEKIQGVLLRGVQLARQLVESDMFGGEDPMQQIEEQLLFLAFTSYLKFLIHAMAAANVNDPPAFVEVLQWAETSVIPKLENGDFPFLIAELCGIVGAELAVVGLNGPQVVAQTVHFYQACLSLVDKKNASNKDEDEDEEDEEDITISFVQRIVSHLSKFLFHLFHQGVPEYETVALSLLTESVCRLPTECLERLQLQDIITLHSARNTLGLFTSTLVTAATQSLKQTEMAQQDMENLLPPLEYVARLQCRFPTFLVQALHNVCSHTFFLIARVIVDFFFDLQTGTRDFGFTQ